MKIKIFFLIALLIVFGCGKKQKTETPEIPQQTERVPQSDKQPNGGLLRFTLRDKPMFDNYFVAQFTPKGDIFLHDNLQLFNYNRGSDKYPQFLINIDGDGSDLKQWQGKTFSLDFLAFTISATSTPLNSRGEVQILNVTADKVEGCFSGELVNPVTKKSYPIRGEFKAMVKMNV